eukprot:5233726-Prymnesium_polylepis.1
MDHRGAVDEGRRVRRHHASGGRHPATSGAARRRSPAESEAAVTAADALHNLASNDTNGDVIGKAGAIPPLVALLHAGADSEAANSAAGALQNVSCDHGANKEAIFQAGAVPLLVALLGGGADSEVAGATENAAAALRNLADTASPAAAIVEAGGIPPLVALLRHTGTQAADHAAVTLDYLAWYEDPAIMEEILAALPSALPQPLGNRGFLRRLRAAACRLLEAAEANTDVAALERAIERARL